MFLHPALEPTLAHNSDSDAQVAQSQFVTHPVFLVVLQLVGFAFVCSGVRS
jgi:hypothetical protein